jgi:cytochrome c-type biogenesis protein CcmH/NrfF
MRRAAAGALALLALALSPSVALAAKPQTTLVAVEQQVMCVTCQIPLQEAESPAANQERAFIQQRVSAGETMAEIKHQLVLSYGVGVLALPPASGFNLAVYLVPIGALAGAIALGLLLLPRWRRRRRPAEAGLVAPLSVADAARLDAELSRFDA